MQYAEKFFRYIRERECPLDFFSWHCYINADSGTQHCHCVADAALLARAADHLLKKYGYENAGRHLNEWNNAWELRFRGTAYAAANAAAMMLTMQDTDTDMLCYYDARIGESCFGGMFNPLNYQPLPLYYSFKAFGELYALGTQARSVSDNPQVCVQAAVGGGERLVMLANLGEDAAVTLSCGTDAPREILLVDEEHSLSPAEDAPGRTFELKKYQTALIRF